MKRGLTVLEVFDVAGRVVIAADAVGANVNFGKRFRSEDGTEIIMRGIAFSSAEAWAHGRRGLVVELVSGRVAPGQVFTSVTNA